MCEHCRNSAEHYALQLAASNPPAASGQRTLLSELPAILPVVAEHNPPVYPLADSADDDDSVMCEHCGNEFARDDITTDRDCDAYCNSCYSELYTSCECCSEELSINNGDVYSPDDGSAGPMCESCYSDRFVTCAGCNCTVSTDNTVEHNRREYCTDCYHESFGDCEGCGGTFSRDDLSYSEDQDGDYCCDCYRESSDCGDFEAKRFRPTDNSYARTGSRRSFGVELETSECSGYMELDGSVYFGAKEDGSIDGKEFVSAVLSGDKGLEAISDFCEKADRKGFAVDSKCGFHAHFDVSDLSIEQRCRVLYAYRMTYEVWTAFVSEKRRRNSYCAMNSWDCDDILELFNRCDNAGDDGDYEFRSWCGHQDRYQWMNVKAFNEHGTFESRLHGGTLDEDKVNNWVVANIRFIDAVADMSFEQLDALFSFRPVEAKFSAMAELWRDDKLTAFYAERAAKFGCPLVAPQPADQQQLAAVAA